ncbi:MAG: DUF6089 family protein [Chitinophagaceae bacterium]
MNKTIPLTRVRLLALTIMCLICSTFTHAQNIYEIGITAGPSNFLGDLGGTRGRGGPFLKDNNLSMTSMVKSIYFSFAPSEFISFKLAFTSGRLQGADSIINGAGGLEENRIARNQSFRSPLTEALLTTEIYPTALFDDDPSDVYHKIRPFGIIGVGVFHFNPQGLYVDANGNSQWVDLKPLRTEGQGIIAGRPEYKLTQINIPYGFGLKYFVNDKVNVSLEVLGRKTFTDYIDDVSTTYIDENLFYNYFKNDPQLADMAVKMAYQSKILTGGQNRAGFNAGDKRGTATNYDAYYTTSLRVAIRLGSDNKGITGYKPQGRSSHSKLKCPIRF